MRLKIKKSQTEKLLNTLEGGARIGTQSGSARPSLETHGQIVAARESNFLRAFFSRPFRRSLTPTIYPLVSEDSARPSLREVLSSISSYDLKSFFPSSIFGLWFVS